MNINHYYYNLLHKHILIDYMNRFVTALLLTSYNDTSADREDTTFIFSFAFAFEAEVNVHSIF